MPEIKTQDTTKAARTSVAFVGSPVEKPAALPDITITAATTVAARGIARNARSFSTPRAGGFSLKEYSVDQMCRATDKHRGTSEPYTRSAFPDSLNVVRL